LLLEDEFLTLLLRFSGEGSLEEQEAGSCFDELETSLEQELVLELEVESVAELEDVTELETGVELETGEDDRLIEEAPSEISSTTTRDSSEDSEHPAKMAKATSRWK
jgi:hypothetical protein